MPEQQIIKASESYQELDVYLQENEIGKVLLVCDSSISFLRINNYFETLEVRTGIKVVRFSDFTPNPLYESVVAGVKLFLRENCDLIIAVGGGSAMDVAKCIKLYFNMDHTDNYLQQPIVPNSTKLLAMPTTAGTGSEATRYAVIYYNGEKQSVSDYSCIPSAVLMDASALKTLPLYQKKATMMDAFCHSIEAFWSVNSTEESKRYSREAIEIILHYMEQYLTNEDVGNEMMLKAANLAGKAINITQTTAGHAMSYKLTSMYGIAHGHAAALCVSKLWPHMIQNIDRCMDPRGGDYLESMFEELEQLVNVTRFQQIVKQLELDAPTVQTASDFEVLKKSVNPVRMKNNPVGLDEETIDELYHQIMKGK